MDGRFCVFFSLFVKDRNKYGILVNTPVKESVNLHKIVDSHSSNLFHLVAMADSSNFVQSVENPQHNVDQRRKQGGRGASTPKFITWRPEPPTQSTYFFFQMLYISTNAVENP